MQNKHTALANYGNILCKGMQYDTTGILTPETRPQPGHFLHIHNYYVKNSNCIINCLTLNMLKVHTHNMYFNNPLKLTWNEKEKASPTTAVMTTETAINVQ